MQAELFQWIRENESSIRRLREEFHRIPEPPFAEVKTAAKAAAYLRRWGYDVQEGVGRTGVTALLRGGLPGKTVALRADLDALPITENTGLEFASEHPGYMHACGHDSHIAAVLGAAQALSVFRSILPGTVKIFLQPAEEIGRGAEAMIADGALQDPKPDAIFALHNWPGLPAGVVATAPGPVTGSVDRFSAIIQGRGGHGATPEQTCDPVVAASHCVLALQTIVSRLNDPLQPLVVTVGEIKGGTAFNVIPDAVSLVGTVRAGDPMVQKQIPGQMEQVLENTAAAYGCTVRLDYTWGIPAVVNHKQLTAELLEALRAGLGGDAVMELPQRSLVGEDFSLFLHHVPGVFLFLGTGESGPRLHHPEYYVDERVLGRGVEALVLAALNTWQKHER